MPEIQPGRRGLLLILSAPSGGGKSTLARRLRATRDDVEVSVSHTTRAPRGEEQNGVEYHFVSKEEFLRLVDEKAFAEYATVYGNFYGTSRAVVEGILSRGNHVILDIDTQGGEQLMAAYPEAVSVFVVPPSLEELEARLRTRGTESEDSLTTRLALAQEEMAVAGRYDYVVVNDQLEPAVKTLHGILDSETNRSSRMKPVLNALLSDKIRR